MVFQADVDTRRQPELVRRLEDPVPRIEIDDSVGRRHAVERVPHYQSHVARLFRKGEILARVVAGDVPMLRILRFDEWAVIEAEAVFVPAVEPHRHVDLGRRPQRAAVGGQVLLDQCFQPRARRRGHDPYGRPCPDGDDEPLILDRVGREAIACRLFDARQRLQIGKILGLEQFCLVAVVAEDLERRGRLAVAFRRGVRAGQRAVGPQLQRWIGHRGWPGSWSRVQPADAAQRETGRQFRKQHAHGPDQPRGAWSATMVSHGKGADRARHVRLVLP